MLMKKTPKDVSSYIAAAPPAVRPKLKQLRAIIRKSAPQAAETISYGMPYYSYHGRLAYFACFKDHISLFAMPPLEPEFAAVLKDRIRGKSTIHFQFDEKLPVALIRKIILARVRRNELKRDALKAARKKT
jgi:uncharacterized protein YdhG (YjbR/CyaY superfamily)